MSDNFKKKDLRVLKTYKALFAAMSKLLNSRNFNHITIIDLCKEALISRTTFYSHFIDKYDLLKHWLTDTKLWVVNGEYKEIEKTVNGFVGDNVNIVKNLVESANDETNKVLCEFILSLLNISIEKENEGSINPNGIIYLNYCCGGTLDYLLWQVRNNYPTDLPVMNPYIYDMLTNLQQWNSNQK